MKPVESVEEEEVVAEERPKKIKTRSENTVGTVEWSQEQQRALEAALTKYPKGASVDRWEKIANCIEGKTKVRDFYLLHILSPFSCVVDYIEKLSFIYRKNAKRAIDNW